ncbi:LLM class flavin-dependent oxidoreductase [Leekyejoonella antrihumi]|uniref:LLM class flavin-dependent oxidoreductase n=1 Tax=Leekyejoonella antrihumi TaxID=1660198 RepID=A0A563E9S5_9MICO|nr:LLM class flavin-dependent oxidoreductase [Leekyejoonella antrihumi]TWP38961.1 LLM class flavin-dependent oxidoreductase [Leekyejoonella antrihumi]
MRCGVVILPESRWEQQEAIWGRAERLGFDHAWTYDHLVWQGLPDAPWFGTMPTLTAAATVTSSIGLGTFVSSPNFRHPVSFMRDILAVDDISAGRFICGLGVGGDLDARILGGAELTTRERVDRFQEFVPLLDRLLRTDHVTVQGVYFSAEDARNLPGTVQLPRVPFVIAANGPRNLTLAARYGQGWVTTGRGGDSDEQWWAGVRELRDRLDAELDRIGRIRDSMDRYLSADASGTAALQSVDRFVEVAGRAAELGFTDIVTHWPRAEGVYAESLDVLESVAADVLPGLSSAPGRLQDGPPTAT